MTDETIIDLFWNRDEAALSAVGERYGRYLQTVAERILANGADAEECVSDAYLRAWNAIPPARPTVLKAFLAKITRNLALNRLRDSHAEKRGEFAEVLDELSECVGPEDTERALNEKELTLCVNRFLHTLPERDCGIFLRRCFYAEPVKEIARRYRITADSVSVILNRTRKKLKEVLRAEGYIS